MGTIKFTRSDRRRLAALQAAKKHNMHMQQHRRERREELLRKCAPAAWLNRLTQEIDETMRTMEFQELEISELLDKQYAARKEARGYGETRFFD